MRKDSDNACFFSANSFRQKAKYFGTSAEGRAAETNYKLGTQLPYMFIVSRLAHYLKVLQRENLGSWKALDLQRELSEWIRQYVVDMDNRYGVRSRRPLRQAQVTVEWTRAIPMVQSRFEGGPTSSIWGHDITLSLVSRLEQSNHCWGITGWNVQSGVKQSQEGFCYANASPYDAGRGSTGRN